MSDDPGIGAADMVDRHLGLMAVAALSMSFMFLTRALTHVVDGPLAGNLDYLVLGFAVIGVGLIVPTSLWKFRNLRKLSRRERDAYFNPDGFVSDIFNRAQRVSWASTFLLLIAADGVVFDQEYQGYLRTLPVEFYLQAIVGLMLGIMASVFLVLNWVAGPDDARA